MENKSVLRGQQIWAENAIRLSPKGNNNFLIVSFFFGGGGGWGGSKMRVTIEIHTHTHTKKNTIKIVQFKYNRDNAFIFIFCSLFKKLLFVLSFLGLYVVIKTCLLHISYSPSVRAVLGEYCPEVLTVRTEHSKACTKLKRLRAGILPVRSQASLDKKRFIAWLKRIS